MFNCSCSIGEPDVLMADYWETVKVASKPLVCCECHAPIAVGQRYEEIIATDEDGENWNQDTCLTCVAIWNDVFDGERLLGGCLQERLWDCNGPYLTAATPEFEWEEIDKEDAAHVECERRKRENASSQPKT